MENKKEIKKIMERETAKKQIEAARLQICGVDLEELCSDECENIKEQAPKVPDVLMKYLENAWMCGLVYIDEDKNCLTQKFIKPLKSGELSCEQIYYEHELTLGQIKGQGTSDQTEMLIKVLSLVSGRPTQLLAKLRGQDVQISMACVAFFEV